MILFMVDNGASAERSFAKVEDLPWGSVGTFQGIGRDWANAANTPLRVWKGSSMEGGINTPMIIVSFFITLFGNLHISN